MLMHEDRLFPVEPFTRGIARALYESVKSLPIVSPHGHTQAAWFAENQPFPDPAKLLVQPDHYVFRMLYSQGISLDDLEIDAPQLKNPRKVWQIFAANYFLFRGTPTRLWLDYIFQELFGFEEPLSKKSADRYFDIISHKLSTPEFLPRALYERFNLEVLSTTDSPLDSLEHHKAIRESGWQARILPTFRPDPVVDPEFDEFADSIVKLGELTGEDTTTWNGYLNALIKRRIFFRELGCTATDHGHPTAQTADLSKAETETLFRLVLSGKADAIQQEQFRAQMLTESARMSLEDGFAITIANSISAMGATSVPTFRSQSTTSMHCVPCSTASATNPALQSSCSRWMKPPSAENWRPSRDTIPACVSDLPGGFSTALRA
jgi:glucuronate isomerase